MGYSQKCTKKLEILHFLAYVYKIFIYVIETLSWAHFKDNFTLNQKLKICITLKWVLAPALPHSKPEKSQNWKIWMKAYIPVLKA